MSEFAVMPLDDYVSACDTIREKTENTEVIKSGELTEKVNLVYEAGGKSEYDRFWDNFQNKGEPQRYYWAFTYNHFTDDNYNPKYDIVCSEISTSGQNIFYATSVTDTKVPIYANSLNANAAFYYSSRLVTIRKFIVYETTTFRQTFENCSGLKNITMGGTIGQDISFPVSPLTVDSMKSIISCLKDYSGTSSEGTYTVTFSPSCWQALEADSSAPNGDTWENYVISLGWLT